MAGKSSIIKVRILSDVKGFTSGLDQAQTRLGKIRSGFQTALGPATAIGTGLLSLGKLASDSASDLNESANAVRVTFGAQAAAVEALSKKAATSVGLSSSEFNSMAVQFSAFTDQIGGGGAKSVQVLDDMSTRIADFASVMNLDVAQAAEKFQSGLAGETEPLRKFGIDLSAAKVQAYAYAEGIAAAGKPLTEAQKVQARYALLMKQTAKTQGDFANTSGEAASAQRIANAQWDNARAKLGTALLPAIAAVASALAGLAGWVSDNSTAVLTLAAVIGGLVIAVWAVNAATAAWTAMQAIAAGAAKVWAGVQWLLNAALAANPISLVVIAIAALVAAIVVAWNKSETFRNVVLGAWSAIKSGVGAAVAWLRSAIPAAFEWIKSAFLRFTPLGIVISHWGQIKAFIAGAVASIRGVIGWFGSLPGRFGAWFGAAKDAAAGKLVELVTLLRSLPGRALEALGNIGSTLLNAGKSLIQGFIDGIKNMLGSVRDTLGDLTSSLTDWKGPPSRDASLLTGNGRLVIQGFVRGLEAEYGAARSSLGRFTRSLVTPSVEVGGGLGLAGSPSSQAGSTRSTTYNVGVIPAPEDLLRQLRAHEAMDAALHPAY